jgi:hypothetical protein
MRSLGVDARRPFLNQCSNQLTVALFRFHNYHFVIEKCNLLKHTFDLFF